MLLRSYGDTDFITGLRALAALMVVAVHTRAFDSFGWIGEMVTDNGKFGVQIFFIISGFTIVATFRTSGGYGPYILRRAMRIIPLYYLAILVYFALTATGVMGHSYFMILYDSEPSLYNLFMHLTFLSPWDTTVANSLIGVEWTVPIEIYWYALMPFLLVYRLSWSTVWKVVLLLLILSGLTRAAGALWFPKHAAHFMPPTYGAYFFLGAWCHHLRETYMKDESFAVNKWLMAGYGCFFLALFTDSGFSSVLTSAFVAAALVCYRDKPGRFQLLRSRPFLLIGSVSYSFYLWHLLMVFCFARMFGAGYFELDGVLKFVVITLSTLAVACLSYMWVEYPTNRMGIKMAKRINARRSEAAMEKSGNSAA